MHLFVERSGFGRYGICTLVPTDQLAAVVNLSAAFWDDIMLPPGCRWECPVDLNLSWKIGVGGAFVPAQSSGQDAGDPSYIKLLWSPSKLKQSLLTQAVLSGLFGEETYSLSVEGDRLAIFLTFGSAREDWSVQADLGPLIWDVIESSDFTKRVLPEVNRELGLWYEDRDNRKVLPRTMVGLFGGKDRKTLQVSSPTVPGLWIDGVRKSGHAHQLSDHNTDSWEQAFCHIIALLLIQDACRKLLRA